MPTYTYGNSPNDFIEIPDPANAGQVKRPLDPIEVKVKASPTLADLPPVMSAAYGYLPFTSTEKSVRVSADNFATYKVLFGQEALDDAVDAGDTANQALGQVAALTPQVSTAVADSAYARSRADYAVSQIGTGGGSFTGSVSWSSQVTDKPTIAPQSAITTPVSQSGTTYPTPAAAYGRWWFTGTADPTVQGIAPRNGDRWTKVKLA